MDIDKFQKILREFASERDWEKFHTPKNLVMALSGEVGELNEIFQWVSEQDSFEINSTTAKFNNDNNNTNLTNKPIVIKD